MPAELTFITYLSGEEEVKGRLETVRSRGPYTLKNHKLILVTIVLHVTQQSGRSVSGRTEGRGRILLSYLDIFSYLNSSHCDRRSQFLAVRVVVLKLQTGMLNRTATYNYISLRLCSGRYGRGKSHRR